MACPPPSSCRITPGDDIWITIKPRRWNISVSQTTPDIDKCAAVGPQSVLEKKLIEEHLQGKGYALEDLHSLPKEEAQQLMRAACTYASLKLAEVESRARFRQEIHGPS